MRYFKFIATIYFVSFLHYSSCRPKSDNSKVSAAFAIDTLSNHLNGLYEGVEEMCSTDSAGKKECYDDPENRLAKWYHLSQLRIHNDSAFLEQSPISIYNGDTSYSASDGGFYYYKGSYKLKDSIITIDFKMDHCDYCAIQVEKLEDGQLRGVERPKMMVAVVRSNELFINGYTFKRNN